jgi:uncharacterized protein (TIGR02757 family)
MTPRARRARHPAAGLGRALDALCALHDDGAVRVEDPVDLVRPYREAADREVAGLLAAGLAFGRVAGIMRSVRAVLDVLGPSPAAFAAAFDERRDRGLFAPLGHRWTRGEDLAALIGLVRRMRERDGSIEGFFLRGHDAGAVDVEASLESFSRRALALAGEDHPRRRGLAGFFPRPSAGSACKRLNLYLRWMVRADGVDPGGWTGVSRSQLVVPLDVHVMRVGRCLGLTRRVSPGWPMASEITAALRALDPADPVRYDFALCHLGMAGACGFSRPSADSRCPLRGWCRPRPRRRPASAPPSGRP